MRRALAIVLVLVTASLGVILTSVTDGDAQSTTQFEPLFPGQVREILVAGTNGVPADALAVTLNVTAADPSADGYLTVFPCGESVPTASNLNFRSREEAVPNAVVVRVGSGGKICLVSSAYTSVVVDVAGYVPAGSTLAPLPAPRRLLDTRDGLGAPAGPSGPGVLVLAVAGREGIPATARAAVLNVTVVGPAGPGYATVFPCDQPRPEASNVNFVAGDIRPNLVLAGLDPQGRTCIFTTQPTHLVVDATASTGAGTGLRLVANPERVLDTRSGLGAPAGPVALGEFVAVQIAGRAGVPTGATSVVLNVTTTGSTRAGFVTAYPCGARPTASNLNHAAGQTVANLVVGRLDDAGRICLFTNVGGHLVADVAGWFEGSTAHQVLAPVRLYDSRAVPTAPLLPPFPAPPGPGPAPTVSFEPPTPSFTFPTTTSTTSTSLPFAPIDTSGPCDVLVYPVSNGSIAVYDLITGIEFVRSDPWFAEGERAVVSRDCTGIYVAGPPEGPTGFGVRFYDFAGDVFTVGDVPTTRGAPTLLDEAEDGRLFATVSGGTWEAYSGARLTTASGFTRPVGAARNGTVAAVTSAILFDDEVSVYSLVTGQLIQTVTLPAHGLDPRLSPDGTMFAVGVNPTPSVWPPTQTLPLIRILNGTAIWSYPGGVVAEPTDMNWISDSELVVCEPGASPRIWTLGGSLLLTRAPARSGCPTGG